MRLRRTVWLACLPLALATGLASASWAQLATGRSGTSTTRYMTSDVAMGELAAFGRCYAKARPAKALSLLATRPGSREEAATYMGLFKGNQSCLASGTRLGFQLAYVRGAIAEGFLRSGAALPPSHRLSAPKAPQVRNLSDAARCYAADHRDEVQSLLSTKPASKAELAAVSAMMPSFRACMPEGVPLNFDPTVVRYRLAEGLLRVPR